MSLKESLKKHEGFRSNVYKCTLGHDTVGYGFKCSDLSADELACNGGKIAPMSEAVADKILDIKIAKLENSVFKALPWLQSAPQPVVDVVCNMVYQMGLNGVLGFKNTLNFLKNGDYAGAASNMMKSKWATQTPNRAKELANIISSLA